MLEVGKSYRTADGRNTGPLHQSIMSNERFVSNLILAAGGGEGQCWNIDGSVYMRRSGEENDRIVGPWVPEITIGGKYRASTGFARVRCVADDHVFYVRQDGSAGTLKVDDFFKHFTFVPPTKTVWVNLWWRAGSVEVGCRYDSESDAIAAAQMERTAITKRELLRTISLEVPA